MSFRARLRLAFLVVVLIPMAAFAFGVRRTMADRLTSQYQRRVAALASVIEDDLRSESTSIGRRLASLREALVDDNRFRSALLGRSERAYLIDYAGNAMRLTGLSMLQIQDATGRIISSGHFRMEYDRLEPELPGRLTTLGGALVEARTPESTFLALARIDSFQVGTRRLYLVGGSAVDRSFLARLARGEGMSVSLAYPGGTIMGADTAEQRGAADDRVAGELEIPFVEPGSGELAVARIIVTHPLTELQELRRRIDLWFLAALGITVVVALVLAHWLASRISRPLAELAQKTSRIDLDRLNVDFASSRKDEVGALSRLLGAMTERLRASAGRLREVERRAALGELARQVNHDIKNGLTPIRNVFRHLAQVARDEPDALGSVFDERRTTLDSSIAYLESLASNYARLYPRLEPRACDLNATILELAAGAALPPGARLDTELAAELPPVHADAVVLRRILENLVDNAIDSLEGAAGVVTVSTEAVAAETDQLRVRATVTDTGCGMSEAQRAKIFDDFYSTKADGTGLGLSIVRRLLMDLNGTIRVESEEGKGSHFTIELPAAAASAGQQGGTNR